MASTDESSNPVLLQGITRHINCLGEENRNTRRSSLMNIKKETVDRKPELEQSELKNVFSELLKPLLRTLSDPVEKCRELSVSILMAFFQKVSNPEEYLSYTIPVFVQRLGQQEIVEPSEEIRLQLVEVLSFIIEKCGNKIGVYVEDCVRILQRTLIDPYADVKKESCKCSSLLAKSSPQNFYMQAESLVKPLLLNIAHQHSKVRLTIVETIGTVLQYSNGKAVDDVISHLAQRLFDKTPAVRRAVTKVVGGWLLDLPDRYSYHHKLIPLLLTSLSDEQADIQGLADGLWHDIGLKYERENEEELKDKLNFPTPQPKHYPPGVERPTLGCRVLVNRHLSKILPGLVRDLNDWVVETRMKCASLLYWLLINAEEYTTQHVEILLSGLFKAGHDEEPAVVKDVQKCGELVGYFVQPDIWKKLVLTALKQSLSHGVVMTLAAIVRGSDGGALQDHQVDLANSILNADICQTIDAKMHVEIISFCSSLLSTMGADIQAVSQQLFNLLITVIAMSQNEDSISSAKLCLDQLAKAQGFTDRRQLFENHTKPLIDSFGEGIELWANHSAERQIFDTLLVEAGPVVGGYLDDIIPIMVTNLNPSKDPELRLKFFSLLSHLILAAPTTVDSEHHFADFAGVVVKDMILPNCVWKAGKTAGAIRTTAISCMWALLQSGLLTREKMEPIVESVLTQLTTLIEDDNKTTRQVACRVMTRTFDLMGTNLDQDRLHNLYPELLKRLDDSSDDIRLTVTHTIKAYFDCFQEGYDVSLYRAHLEAIYRGLLVHLDDPETKIQEAVLELLNKAAELAPQMLLREVESVKLKHRSTKYCEQLIQNTQKLAIKEDN